MEVILNADDFGSTYLVNAAVEQAYRRGVLTSASLMVTGGAFDEAVALARRLPGLAVGLHLVLTEGRPVLPPHVVPHLVGPRGRFPSDPVWAGLHYFFSPAARRELSTEIQAQFERFAQTGLPLSHVDGHQNLHIHPAVFPLVVRLAEQHHAAGLRLPRADLRLDLRPVHRGLPGKLLSALALELLSAGCAAHLKGRPLKIPHRVYGLLESGSMRADYVLYLLQHMRQPTAELYFHPSQSPAAVPFGPNPTDLATLLNPAVQAALRARDIRLCSYRSLKGRPT